MQYTTRLLNTARADIACLTRIVCPPMNALPASNARPAEGVSIVIPAFNEEDVIGDLLAEIADAMPKELRYEVIVVDDGSSDGTPRVLAQAKASGAGRVRALRHRARAGQSAALRSGVRAARYAWIATLDGDGQNDPRDIPRLLAALGESDRDGGILVCGHRRRRQDSWLKRLSSRIANGVRSRLLGDQVSDTGCGLKVFARETFLQLPWFDHMHRFLPALMQREGIEVVAVDVNHRPRLRGRSKYGVHNRLWVGIVDMFGVMWLKRRGKVVISDEIE